MKWPKKLLACVVYSTMLFVWCCIVGSLLDCLIGGPPGTPQGRFSFRERWDSGAFCTALVLVDLFYVFLIFGCWVAFFPPRNRLAWLVFLLATVAAGLMASHYLQYWAELNPWIDEEAKRPSPLTAAIYSDVLACVTALSGATICYFPVRRWVLLPPPSPEHVEGPSDYG